MSFTIYGGVLVYDNEVPCLQGYRVASIKKGRHIYPKNDESEARLLPLKEGDVITLLK